MNEGLKDCGNSSITAYREGCRCEACKNAVRVRRKLSRLQNMRRGPLMVDASEARKKLQELSDAGMPQREMCNYGLSLPTVYRIMSGQREMIRRDTHEKIMAIDGRRPNRNQRVDPRGSIELVRKWHDKGLPFDLISRLTGVSETTLREIYRGRKSWLYARTAMRLRMHGTEVMDALVCLVKEKRNGKDD